jgi:hypothetical protein
MQEEFMQANTSNTETSLLTPGADLQRGACLKNWKKASTVVQLWEVSKAAMT